MYAWQNLLVKKLLQSSVYLVANFLSKSKLQSHGEGVNALTNDRGKEATRPFQHDQPCPNPPNDDALEHHITQMGCSRVAFQVEKGVNWNCGTGVSMIPTQQNGCYGQDEINSLETMHLK
jgi:hypothetical protein